MPKAKLTFPKSDAKKLSVAAHFANVTLGETITLGNEMIVETSYRDAQSLVRMVELKGQVTGDELKPVAPAKTAAK